MRRLSGIFVVGLILLLAATPLTTLLLLKTRDSTASSITIIRNGDQVLLEGNIAKDFGGPILFCHY